MASDAAPLELSDILLSLDRHLNPHSSPQSPDPPAADLDRQSRSSTPEPPDEHEILEMRMHALTIRDGKGKGKEDTLLSELVDMVLRLTAAAPARLQVLEQAATIRRLLLQQDFLLQRMDDERATWEAEKESMQRICEALIAQANITSHAFYKEQDSTKKPAVIEAENVTLRTKLADAQARVSSLESELAQLRPLLLMQPSAIAQSKGLTLSPGRPRKKEDTSSISGNTENRNYYRVREERASVNSTPSKGKKKKATSYFKHAPTVADARSEHLLLAARKLGKERASLLSQAMYRPADPQARGPSTAPNHELTMHIKGSAGPSRPLMTPAVWPNPIQHPHQQAKQGGQQSGITDPVKGQQNPPFSQYAPPAGMTYPQQYFVPSGSVPRPGTAVSFYHAPPRGYIPGPAWPYYSPGPYAYGQPIPIQSVGAHANANANKVAQGRPATSPPVAGPSKTPVPGTPGAPASPSGQKGTKKGSTSSKGGTPSSGKQQERGLKTPQSKTGSTPRNPPTPMDSLLSAAQSVFSPNARGRSPSTDGSGSPAPKKRRRVEQRRGQQAPASEVPSNLERQASALDVLADQAAGVESSQRSRSGSKSREGSGSTGATKEPGERTAAADIGKPTAAPPAKGAPLPTAARRGKRPTRASSTTPASGTSSSLAPPVTVQRAASEEHTAASGSAPPADAFKLRPVQSNTAARMNAPGRSASLPRTGTRAGAGRGRQTNGRASTPLRPSLTSATPSVDADIDAEGDEVESEDDMDADADADADAEIDELHRSTLASKDVSGNKGKGPAEAVDPGEDVNSRRWLEILGRKDS